jgi:glycosyltransferase 2 family protein
LRPGERSGTSAPTARGATGTAMKKLREFIWPLIGLGAVAVSVYLLWHQLKGLSLADVEASLRAIAPHHYAAAALSTLVAYAALAWYDRIALLHLGVKGISWLFVSLCSFTTYALSHNIGASVFSGALVRYRAYTSKGLSAAQVAVLVALCSFTFGLGTMFLGGLVLTLQPNLLERLHEVLPALLTNPATARVLGLGLLAVVALYVVGSILHLKPLTIRSFKLEYPRPQVMVRQLIAAPLELLGAAGIIYFALPEAGNPGFLTVLAVFLASFSAALVSHAPGGLGVFELVFLKAMPDMPQASVLAALLIFRLFYLLLPFAMAIVVVLLFERGRLAAAIRGRADVPPTVPAPPVDGPGVKPDLDDVPPRVRKAG